MADKGKKKETVVEPERVKALIGFNFPGTRGEKRVNEGDIVYLAELPPTSVGWLMRDKVIEIYVPPTEGDTEKEKEGGGK